MCNKGQRWNTLHWNRTRDSLPEDFLSIMLARIDFFGGCFVFLLGCSGLERSVGWLQPSGWFCICALYSKSQTPTSTESFWCGVVATVLQASPDDWAPHTKSKDEPRHSLEEAPSCCLLASPFVQIFPHAQIFHRLQHLIDGGTKSEEVTVIQLDWWFSVCKIQSNSQSI